MIEHANCISTGQLPDPALVQALVSVAHARFRSVMEGRVADYIPALAAVPLDLFGICVAGTRGECFEVGDSAHPMSIQSVSKPFMFALVCQAIGEEAARERLGVNSTGLPFNSVIAVERSADGLTNPMVNAGAIATTSLAPGNTAEATDLYTRQCALRVTARDLAVMAATLANGGVNPLTREPIIDPIHCQHVLAVMVTAGLYESSGEWLYETGLPGKSGVSGALITVAPGKGALATFSPPLDEAGNSVRGQLAARFLAAELGLNLFASRPATVAS